MTDTNARATSDPVPRARVSRRVVGELRPHWWRVTLTLLVDLLETPVILLTPIPLKIVVDSVIGTHPPPAFISGLPLASSSNGVLWIAAILQVLVVIFAGTQAMAAYSLSTWTGERMTLAFRARLFRHIQRLSILLHDRRGTADSVYRVQYDGTAIADITTGCVLPVATSLVALVITLFVIAKLSWQLCLVALVVLPVLYYFGSYYTTRMRPRYKDLKGIESGALHVVQEVLTSLRIVKAFGREDIEHARFFDESRRGAGARTRLAIAEGFFGLVVNATTALGTAAVLFIGAKQVESGALTTGQLLLVIAYLAELYAPLKTISGKVAVLQKSMASAERAFEILDEAPEVPEKPNAIPLARARGTVEFRHVAFDYDPDRSWPRPPGVLDDVSFVVPAGTSLGISGRTGAGKTTLISLLVRFFDVESGAILVDDTDVRDYRLADLRNQLAIVVQDPVLLSTSIAENIAYARPSADMREIVAAAQAADVDEFVRAMPDGYDTLVGERGMRLSGGERQRISLARAFLKDAPILVLDEPTSSVDVRTEERIMDAMRRLMVGRTTLMIAHRLGTLDHCDARLHLDGGKLLAPARPAVQPASPVAPSHVPSHPHAADHGRRP